MVTPVVIDRTQALGHLLLSSQQVEQDTDYGHMAVAPGGEPKLEPKGRLL